MRDARAGDHAERRGRRRSSGPATARRCGARCGSAGSPGWCRTRCGSASSWSRRARRSRAPRWTSTSRRVRARCRTCGAEFELRDLILLCACGSADVEVLAGRELEIASSGGGLTHVRDLRLRRPTALRVTVVDEHGHGPRHRPRTTTTSTRTTGRDGRSRWRQALLAKNDRAGRAQPRAGSRTRRSSALNLMSSPGSGKTTLLRAHHPRAGRPRCRSRSSRATRRPRSTPSGSAPPARRVVQINTGAGCHLDADMVRRGAATSSTRAAARCVFVENVGNLVCPALFDLGEPPRSSSSR